MAEAIATGLATEFIKKLTSMAFKKIMSPKADLDSYMKKLYKLKPLVEALLRNIDAFKKSTTFIDGGEIEKLLQGVKDKLDELLQEGEAIAERKEVIGSKRRLIRYLIPSRKQVLLSPSRFTAEYNAIVEDLETIKLHLSFDSMSSLAGNPNPGFGFGFSLDVVAGPVMTEVVIGRDRDRDNIVALLCRSNGGHQEPITVVAIVGIGGQGKTTLARYVCDDERVKGCFDVLLWVASTPYCSFTDIVGEIVRYATDMKPLSHGTGAIHTQFSRARSAIEGKRCLLVLDNIWYQDNLRENWIALKCLLQAGGTLGACISAVLITTRNQAVAEIMDTANPYMLQGLAKSDSLLLFEQFARVPRQEPGVKQVGKEIVALCPDVPLVVKHIGCQLAQKLTKDDWLAYLKNLASKGAVEMDDVVMATLKVSYDQLEENLKSCVAYCLLFPSRVFNTRNMILYWMALGFVEPRENESLEETGQKYVEKLAKLNFFEQCHNFYEDRIIPLSNCFKLHDVMYDLITSTSRSKHQMINNKTKKITEGVRHVSLDTTGNPNWELLLSKFKGEQLLQSILMVCSTGDNGGRTLQSRIERLISKFPNLKVLMLYNEGIEKVLKSIGELISLRHLDLSRNPLHKLPNSITMLVYLLTLNLSYCKNLEKLPEDMGKLVNLLTLNLSNCEKLEELPSDMGKLVKLRHLQVHGCKLSHMPLGLGNLTELETLDEFIVGDKTKRSSAAKLEELRHLNNLKGSLRIYVGGQSKDIVSEAREAHLEHKTQLTRLDVVFKKRVVDDEQFLEGLQPSGEKLERLIVRNYGGKRLPRWMTNDQFHHHFPNLIQVYLFCCESTPIYNPFMFRHECDLLTISVDSNEVDLLEWVPGYSRLKEHLKMGPMELSCTSGRGDGRLTNLSHLTLRNVWLRIEKELAPRSDGGRQQPDFLLKNCFPNLRTLELYNIPELEVIPNEFKDLCFLVSLRIENCPKLKEMPDWIHSLSSLETLKIENAPELKELPNSIVRLTSLVELILWGCRGIESLPHQISNLPDSCGLNVSRCSTTLFEKCRKPTGEYWVHIRHLRVVTVTSFKGDKLEYWRGRDM